MSETLRVLIVDDSPSDAKLVVRELRAGGRSVQYERVDNVTDMRTALVDGASYNLIICDWSMPSFTAPDALALLKELELDIPFIIVSGTIGEENAVEAMRAGAQDYVLKDRLARLIPAVERELRECKLREAHRESERALRVSEKGRRESEGQLRQAQKMEAVGRLAGGVAHDFNNVLSVILSYGELMYSELKPGDPMREDVDEIRKAAKRAADITRQLLMFSRQQVLEPRILDLNEVLLGMSRMVRRLLGEDVELVLMTAPTLGHVRVDRGSIEQVVMNLVMNARDAMPTGGKLTMQTADVDLDERYARAHLGMNPGPHVMLALIDTGTGMDKATQARIFEPFFTTKGKDKGTGLGLPTAFGIVQQSGGSLRVYSELGKGTTFKIYLPRELGPLESTPPRSDPATLLGSETILLVEDEDQVRAVARGILRSHGYEVIEARHGEEALTLAARYGGTIQLLLSDVVMPQMSGPDLAERITLTRPEIKVLFMSGYTDDSIIHHGVLRADVAFLQKPITPDVLTRKVRAVLDLR
jgi:two-component system cell cycle sensor histidine kinase/response regulator CckA